MISVDEPNRPPQLNFIGDTVAIINQPLRLLLQAGDRNQEALAFSLTGLNNATLAPTTVYGERLLEWTPTQAGTYNVTLNVSDSGNGTAANIATTQQSFQIVVRSSNQAPVLNAIAPQSVREGQLLTIQLAATDADGDRLTYRATNLPLGAVLDPVTGRLTWTPTFTQQGTYTIDLTATDGNRLSTQPLTIQVLNVNQAPTLIPLPLQSGQEGVQLNFAIAATDLDGDSVRFSAVTPLPEGAILNANTGMITWIPGYEQAGNYRFQVSAIDALGGANEQDVRVRIANVNRVPTLSVSNRAVGLGEAIDFMLSANDRDANTTLVYSADRLPEGATLDSQTGRFRWTPGAGQAGDYTINFTVSDGSLSATRAMLIRAQLAPINPTVVVDLTPSFAAVPGQQILLQTGASSLADIVSQTMSVNGQNLTLDAQGRATFTATSAGRFVVEATATDADNRIGRTQTILRVRDPQDTTPPIVEFAPDLNGSRIVTAINLIGTVQDTNLDEWALEIARFGSDRYETIGRGIQTVGNRALSQLNPNGLLDGFYQLRLRASDISGRTSVTEAIIEVQSAIKKNFVESNTDLATTIGGASINLVRTYDSLRQDEAGEFGNGWFMAGLDTDLQTNVPATGRESTGVYNPFHVGTRLYLTAPTGERIGFTFAPMKQEIAGLVYYTPAWVADAGVNYTLQSAESMLSIAGNRFYDLTSARPYNPASVTGTAYTLTAINGTQYDLDAGGQIREQRTRTGERLFYSASGITSLNGESVRIVRGENGRIDRIVAPDGSQLVYSYENGNLVAARNLATGDGERYGYDHQNPHQLTIVSARPGEAGTAIQYGATISTSEIELDLGSAIGFNGRSVAGSVVAGQRDRVTFSLRDSELASTSRGFVLVGVEVTGTGVELPGLNGMTPLVRQTNGGRAYAVYAVDRAGLNLLEIAGAGSYNLQLSIAGDVNKDGAVDGTDSGLMMAALGSAIGQSRYSQALDLDQDGAINATDVQILGSNYGFVANRAPVVKATSVLTHKDLETTVSLSKLASDPDGDKLFYRFANVQNGAVTFGADGQSIRFTPTVGYTGVASFEIMADDSFSTSTPALVSVNVSNGRLLTLDFVKRDLKLDSGESAQLQVIGDFEDQQDVVLPSSYLTFGIEDSTIASVSTNGLATGLRDGIAIFSASRDGIEAVTAIRVGDIPRPQNEQKIDTAFAEERGLKLYPQAVTLTPGVTRRLLVGIEGFIDSPDLALATSGTRYFISNPDVLTITPDGVITALNNGIANVTIVNGAAEAVVSVQVQIPHWGETTLDSRGGAIEASDGSGTQVMIAPGALLEPTRVNIKSLPTTNLPLEIPAAEFRVVSAFQLDLGSQVLSQPTQFAVKAPEDMVPGTEVYFMRLSELPNEMGGMTPTWLIEETGKVGDDGMIRTQSPPAPGNKVSGTFAVVAFVQAGKFAATAKTIARANFLAETAAIAVPVTTGVAILNPITAAFALGFTAIAVTSATVMTAALFVLLREKGYLDALVIPTVGLPYRTSMGVDFNASDLTTGRVPVVNARIPNTSGGRADVTPTILSRQIDYDSEGAFLRIFGKNFGAVQSDLKVKFSYGTQTLVQPIEQLLPFDGSQSEIRVRVPNAFPISDGLNFQIERSFVGNATTSSASTTPPLKDYVWNVAARPLSDRITVLNADDPRKLVAEKGDVELYRANIPVGDPTKADRPRFLAATGDGSRIYVSLEGTGGVAVVDPVGFRQLDINAKTDTVDSIQLDAGARPGPIVIGANDKFAYVADRNPYRYGSTKGLIFVIDIDP
ncbi:putative Ig domain-containing protein, partial [Pseudanabaenaceae cyanobacterium LEGE 13415]|nr:putative Ig domain-containing protein [Pseudanabaenaceae cyanobacterium LEGE 13415]